MQLNRNAEVAIHGIAADCEFTIERKADNQWVLEVFNSFDNQQGTFTLTNSQASATLALFIGEIEDNETLNIALYEIAEVVWKPVSQSLRMIP